MDAALTEMPVRQPVQPEADQQLIEVAQVGTQPRGGHCRVLPARMRRGVQGDRGQAGRIGADRPQPGGLGGIGHYPALDGTGRVHHGLGALGDLRGVIAD